MSITKKSEKIALKLDNIVKFYGEGENKVHALKGVNLSFRKNEFVSILGPSGCGKTTLLNIIGGLDRYSSGDLIIEGKSTKDYDDKDWDAYRNNSIGFVFQSYNLIPHQTVLGNVELALELSGIKKSERKARAIKMLEKVGLKNQLNKKPNQLSGGQMQRVAIARALINDPEIILADEPTGALDTDTSIQIMNLLKEVAKDKLVIMVTHNPDLAKKYSTRIINFLDGVAVDDTNPFEGKEVKSIKTQRKPKMGTKTAFALSLKNLISKRARTILTSVAGSIGIIGVALVLALSNGFSIYMDRMQTDTLATYPLTISASSVDLSSFSDTYEKEVKNKYPELNNVVVKKAFDRLTGMLKSNDLTDKSENGFIHYLEACDKKNYYTISYQYGFDMNDYFFTELNYNDGDFNGTYFWAIDTLVNQIEGKYNAKLQSAMGLNTSFVRQYIPTIQEMPNSAELLNEQYDILRAKDGVTFESVLNKDNQVFLVVDEYNEISDITLALLGYVGIEITDSEGTVDVKFNGDKEITFDSVIGKELYFANNNNIYKKQDQIHYNTREEFYSPEKNKASFTEQEYSALRDGMYPLEIVGVVRKKANADGILKTGFVYSPKLTKKALTENAESDIVRDAKKNKIPYLGMTLSDMVFLDGDRNMTTASSLAGVDDPSQISIFARDFNGKENIKAYIDDWNDTHEEESQQITYSDMMSMLFTALTTMVDAVTYVLVAFTSISLIVSSVMIGIITYVSVVERTKEIGVLRSLGASKKEVSKIFNAETFLIGLFAGLIGIGVTYLLSIPINLILGNLIANIGKIASLRITDAIILIIISFCLTIIAGLIPSRIAAKKDPVVALRSE